MDYEELKYLIDNFDGDDVIHLQVNSTGIDNVSEIAICGMRASVGMIAFASENFDKANTEIALKQLEHILEEKNQFQDMKEVAMVLSEKCGLSLPQSLGEVTDAYIKLNLHTNFSVSNLKLLAEKSNSMQQWSRMISVLLELDEKYVASPHPLSDSIAEMQEEWNIQAKAIKTHMLDFPKEDKNKDRFGTYKKRKWR